MAHFFRKTFSLGVLTLFMIGNIASYAQSDSLEVAKKIAKTQSLLEAGHLDSAKSDLLELLQMDLNPKLRFETLLLQGDLLWDQGRHQAAYQQYLECLRLGESLTPIDKATVWNRLGNALNQWDLAEEAIIYLDSALQVRRHYLGPEHEEVSHTLNNLGIAYLDIGDFGRAQEYHEEALAIRKSTKDIGLQAQSANNLGLCLLEAGQVSEAVAYFEIALNQYGQLGRTEALADVQVNIGNAYLDHALMDSLAARQRYIALAERCYETALAHYTGQERTLGEQALCLSNLANAATLSSRFRSARERFYQAINLLKGTPSLRGTLAETYFNLAMNYRQEGQNGIALRVLDSCLTVLNFDVDKGELDQISDHQTLLYALYQSASILAESNPNFDQAITYFERLDGLLAYLYTRYESKASKFNLSEISHLIYEQALDLAIRSYQQTGQERYLHKAFYFSERSKGLYLLEMILHEKALDHGGVPQEVLDSISELKNEVARTEKSYALNMTAHPEENGPLKRALFQAKINLEALLMTVSERYPDYFNVRYRLDPPTVSSLQRLLAESESSLLSYFVGSQSIWIFVLNGSDFQVRIVSNANQVNRALDLMQYAVAAFPSGGSQEAAFALARYSETARYLYSKLIAPVEESLQPHLIVIPDRRLSYLSFEGLLSDTSHQNRINLMPYLIRDYCISYDFSARVWQEKTGLGRVEGRGYVGFAPGFEGSDLAPLRYNREEVQLAQDVLGGKAYLAERATKEQFVRQLPEAQIVHLATHGLAELDQDALSFLAFADDSPDTRLYASEIYRLRSKADIVVLSACESGTGLLLEGEGVASLARAFMSAGVRSVLATRWPVDDQATQKIMQRFFESLGSGVRKDEALRLALLQHIDQSSPYKAHPYFWSSFMTLGNMTSIEHRPGTDPILPIVIGGLVILLGLGWWLLHQRTKAQLKN